MLQSMESQTVGHDLGTEQHHVFSRLGSSFLFSAE